MEDLYAAVGSGDIASAQVLNVAQGLIESRQEPQLQLTKPGGSSYRGQIQVQGIGNLLTYIAGCCKPLPGDGITGFITRGKGVSVHRSDCGRLMKLQESTQERIVEVEWGGNAPQDNFEVDVAIEAYDRQGLLRDITELFANARINVLAINTQTNKKRHTATMRMRVEVPNLGALSKLLERLNRLNNVVSASRLMDESRT